jgi:S-DNA-T family DNA segregation ATPase FtsK/SpoIIIE
MKYYLIKENEYYEEYPCISPYKEEVEEHYSDKYIILDEESHIYEYMGELYLGKTGDIVIKGTDLDFEIIGSQFEIKGDIAKENIYHNKRRVHNHTVCFEYGDVFLISNIKLIIFDKMIKVFGESGLYHSKLVERFHEDIPFEGFPHYKRSPRIIKRVPYDKIEIKSPPNESTQRNSLLQTVIPSVAMLAVTVAIGVITGRGMMLFMSVGTTGIMIVVSVIRFLTGKKEQKENKIKGEILYDGYLLRKRKEVLKMYQKEAESYHYNYPSIEKIYKMIRGYDSRIYERSNTDEDFLTISIGKQIGETSFSIQFTDAELEIKEDKRQKQASEIVKKYHEIEKDCIIDLKKAHLGLVGSKSIIHEQLKIYISQLTALQSYHDLQIVVIYDEKYKKDFQWMKWLPHNKVKALNVQGLIYSERMRDQLLNSLNQMLKDRQNKLDESKKEARFVPHFLFVIDEPKLIIDHSIMEFLQKEGDQLGFSIIYTSYLQANLPENIGTVLLLEHSDEGRLLLKEKEYRDESITLEHIGDINLEYMARELSVLNHVQGVTSNLAESITFFQMYNVKHPEELMVEKRWRESNSHKSLAVPLGVRAENDIVYLNLHEKAHGPHGLVGGTTGSGKSEIVQSYILSLAVNFHPYEVGFLLIDYKGGGMAGLFKELPHMLGTITNLDGTESMRAMASIRAELKRRQRIFSKNDVNSINAYTELFKEGKVREPLPHLFLISDEFAELKKAQPEFMKELVSVAVIGRSLGVHLILATQKPSGVVDDQIWANSKFKLALKVQNESDSKELLKTPDAASITLPGRAYLQVGNNEIYELFQSAWSGAAYVKEEEKDVTLDNRVYVMNELGQGELVNQDLSGNKAEKKAKDTQLDVVIDHVNRVFNEKKWIEIKKPWLPSLPKKIVSPLFTKKEEEIVKQGIVLPVGLLDIPEEQAQVNYQIDLVTDGNLMYIASSGYGKSVFLTSAAISLALQYEVSYVNMYILDFGNNTLVSLKSLPHTSEYISIDDTEKYEKFKNIITEEIKFRKKCMSKAAAPNIQVYNEMSEEKLRMIVILIDNYDAVKELGFEEEDYFTKVSRDGAGLGIYFVITATRQSAIRMATANNFKNKIAGFNFEASEVTGLVGRSNYTLPEIRGRAMIKYGESVCMLQIYTMFEFETEIEYTRKIKDLVTQIKKKHPNEEAPHIPVLPEEFKEDMMFDYEKEEADLYIGLEKENVILSGFRRNATPFLILGDGGKGKTNALKVLLGQVIGKEEIVIFDSKSLNLYSYSMKQNVRYITEQKDFIEYMDILEAEVERRETWLKDTLLNESGVPPKELVERLDAYYIFIDDIDDFPMQGLSASDITQVADMFRRACSVGISLIITGHTSKLKNIDDMTKLAKSCTEGLMVSSQGYLSIMPIAPGQDRMDLGEGLLFHNGMYREVLLAKAAE